MKSKEKTVCHMFDEKMAIVSKLFTNNKCPATTQ